MAKVHSVRFHGRTYCGLPCQTIPLASSVSYISCKRCHDGFMEWICSMLQVTARLDEGFHSAHERRRATRTGICQRLSKNQRAATPIPFRDLLLSIARSVVKQTKELQ